MLDNFGVTEDNWRDATKPTRTGGYPTAPEAFSSRRHHARSDEGLPPRPRHLAKRPWRQIFKLVRPPPTVLPGSPHGGNEFFVALCRRIVGWRAATVLIWRTAAEIKPNSKIPTARTGHSAPAKIASDPRVNAPGLCFRPNLLAATQTQMVVTTHPHRYTFSITSITPTSTARTPWWPRILSRGRRDRKKLPNRDRFAMSAFRPAATRV
jgi:hypothetical protein